MKKLRLNIKEWPAQMRAGFKSMRQDMSQMRGTNIWVFIMYGLLFDLVNNLWRPFAVKFLERLGGTELEITLFNALPGLVGAVVLLPGAILFRRFTNKKRATATFIIISRAMLLCIALVPALPPAVRPMLFVILVAIMNCPDALSQTSLQNFLGTVFGGQTRGQAIALRNKFGQAMIPIVTISAGLAITFIPNTDQQRMYLYQAFFVGAFLLGIAEVLMFNRLKVPDYALHPPKETEKRPSDFSIIKGIFMDKNFRVFFLPTLFFAFTWHAAWPLINIFQVMHLQATEMWFAIFALVSGITALISGPFWQKLLHKRGNNITFVVAAALLAANMFVFPFIPNVQIMALLGVFTGFSTVGITTALLNGVLEATPDENRMTYLAFFNTVINISLFIAPFFAHFLLSQLGMRNAMLVVGAMRTASTLCIWLVPKLRRGELSPPEEI